MRKAIVIAAAVALTATGCASNKPSDGGGYKYAKAATFVQHKFNYRSDIVVTPTDHETALWLGNPYARLDGEWVITEWRTVTVMEPRIIQGESVLVPNQTQVPIRKMEKLVYFDFDSWLLKSEAKQTLKALPLNEADGYVIDAHTDAKGSDRYNDKLSERRARAVKKWLMAAGVPEHQITIAGHGEKQPVASNKDKEGRAKNRRAVIHLNLRQPGVQPAQVNVKAPTTDAAQNKPKEPAASVVTPPASTAPVVTEGVAP